MTIIDIVTQWQNHYQLVVSKKRNMPIWKELNFLLEKVSLEDEIGHFFVVNIKFNEKKATPKQLYYNEMFCPIFEKQTIIDTIERSNFQLLETLKENNSKPQSYKSTRKLKQLC